MSRALLAAVSLCFVACATGTAPPSPSKESAPSRSPAAVVDHSVVAKLRTRDRVVSIRAGASGARVTLATLDGDVLGSDLSLDELRTRDPMLYEVVTSSVAGLDASIEPRYRTSPKAVGDL